MTTLIPLNIAKMEELHNAILEENVAENKALKARENLDKLEGVKPKFYEGTYNRKNNGGGVFIILKKTKFYITIQYSQYDKREYKVKIRNYDWGDNEEYVKIPRKFLPRTINEEKINARDLVQQK
jgi:hypothetical protein